MFNIFRSKRTKVQQLIADHGFDEAVNVVAQDVIAKLPSRASAYQFLLQELDGASRGNEQSQRMASESGIPEEHYRGALERDAPEVNEAHNHITNYAMQLMPEQALTARFRVAIDVEVMKHFEFGRFSHLFGREEVHASAGRKNYTIEPNGFTVQDSDSGDELVAVIRDGMFHGVIRMSHTGQQGPLAPWPVGKNPFEDENHFFGNGLSPQGPWSFSIKPSAPFSQILNEARAAYAATESKKLFREKKAIKSGPTLTDVVQKSTQTGFCFWDINDDLGKNAHHIMASSKQVQMAYAYARLAAMTALYLQGVAPKEARDHANAFFASVQQQTDSSLEFQERAGAEAVSYMSTYHHGFTGLFIKAIYKMFRSCEPASERVPDEIFIPAVLDFMYAQQQAART
ncbi:hypothetical protein [Comamonas squillarum]|uniref:Uncharacterized protein n=1 Tax=Comamonas squillarum TaxID=2977320 RepID=A0ABY5ZVZ0_9BURK|nr:hypothetical protein [Comamonas sp. PR12]UXC18158.1 hypothetical protein N4T19_21120 [Comamonas sp. PR12]